VRVASWNNLACHQSPDIIHGLCELFWYVDAELVHADARLPIRSGLQNGVVSIPSRVDMSSLLDQELKLPLTH
jgi:hypothetical protein